MSSQKEIRTTVDRASTKLGPRPGWRSAGLFLVLLWAAHPGKSSAQALPAWVSSTRLVSSDGFATLRWSVETSGHVNLFRISEDHSGQKQISFTDQPQLQVWRREPGDYQFWVQACTSHPEGYFRCGESSSQLTLVVMDRAIAPRDLQSETKIHLWTSPPEP